MRVRFVGIMNTQGYSGGRLLALGMAEALAMTGADVDFLTNNMPEMYKEFESFSRIRMVLADFQNLSPWIDRKIDILVVIPGGDISYHGEWTRHAIECEAKIVLLNFETPNWFNSLSPYKKSNELWSGWDIVSEYSDLILSISGEGNKYAKLYYTDCKHNCIFAFCYPGINTVMADKALSPPVREKNILLISRVDRHKGYNALEALAHKSLTGYNVIVYLGIGMMPRWQLWLWSKKFNKVGMNFEVRSAIAGVEKFTMLKKSSLLYFPSRFEGFGLPPLEAAYCLLPCACSNLPVLEEFGQGAFCYGNPESPDDMRSAVLDSLESGDRLAQEHGRISKIACMDEWGGRIAGIFGKIL